MDVGQPFRALHIGCGRGGASSGLAHAGFDVQGVGFGLNDGYPYRLRMGRTADRARAELGADPGPDPVDAAVVRRILSLKYPYDLVWASCVTGNSARDVAQFLASRVDEDGRRDLLGERRRMFFCVDYPCHPTERAMPQRRAGELTGEGYSVVIADPRGMAGPQCPAFVMTNVVACDPCMILPADSADGVAQVIFRRKYAASPLPMSDAMPWLDTAQSAEELNPSISRMLGLAAHQKLRTDP